MNEIDYTAETIHNLYYLGWLDALACAGSMDAVCQMPKHTKRELLRRGWIRYRDRETGEILEEGQRATSITPLGWECLSVWFKSSGIGKKYGIVINPRLFR